MCKKQGTCAFAKNLTMKNISSYKLHHRICSPEETVKTIKSILEKIQIQVEEYQWDLPFANIHCINLRCKAYPFLVSSGKGSTLHLAKASAYAEFIERIQSGIHFTNIYGLMPRSLKNIPSIFSEKFTHFKDLPETLKKECSFFKPTNNWANNDTLVTQTYIDVFEEKQIDLPVGLIQMACGSNGVASGNNEHEALAHAAFEVLERYVMKQLFYAQKQLPVVPNDVFKQMHAYHLLQEIQNQGFKVIIKDATLNGSFPVLGVLIVKDFKVRYAFGSDFDLDTCLQRCLTEIFQEKNGTGIYNEMLDIKTAVYKNSKSEKRAIRDFLSVNPDAKIPGSLLMDTAYNPDVFFTPFKQDLNSPAARWSCMKQLLKQHFKQVYIRNLSFLGFPTWRVFIPEVSEIHGFGRTISFDIIKELDIIKQMLLQLPILNNVQLKKLIRQLESYLIIDGPMQDLSEIFMHLTQIHVVPRSFVSKLTLFSLLGLLYAAMHDWVDAKKYFMLALANAQNKQQNDRITYCTIMVLFIDGMMNGLDKNSIKQQLLSYFEWIDVQRVLNPFLKDAGNIFKHLNFPVCGDCNSCALQVDCYYNTYKTINSKIIEHHVPTMNLF